MTNVIGKLFFPTYMAMYIYIYNAHINFLEWIFFYHSDIKITQWSSSLKENVKTNFCFVTDKIYQTINEMILFKLMEQLPPPSRFSRVRLCVTPWTAAYQAPPSMGFSRQECWSGVPFPFPIDTLLDPIPHPLNEKITTLG